MLTPTGHTLIENLQPGDLVLARPEQDPGSASPTPQRALEVFVRAGRLFELVVAGRTLRTTPEHPFFVREQGWTPAGELEPGDLLSTPHGEWLPVEQLTDTGRQQTVYNFRVAEYHTYFIAPADLAFDVWVHNTYAPIRGGRYSDVRASNKGGNVNHMPARAVSPYTPHTGPAIWMSKADHRRTASWGSSLEAVAHRQKQAELIAMGKIRDAVNMDINDIRLKFGNKYDRNIQQMLDEFAGDF